MRPIFLLLLSFSSACFFNKPDEVVAASSFAAGKYSEHANALSTLNEKLRALTETQKEGLLKEAAKALIEDNATIRKNFDKTLDILDDKLQKLEKRAGGFKGLLAPFTILADISRVREEIAGVQKAANKAVDENNAKYQQTLAILNTQLDVLEATKQAKKDELEANKTY